MGRCDFRRYFRRKQILAAVLILPFFLSGCKAQKGTYEQCTKELFAMDTYMTVTVNGQNAGEAAEAASEEILRLESLLSAESEGSEVFRLNARGSGELSADGFSLLCTAIDLYEKTNGLFDISIYPVLELWGFPSKNYQVPTEKALTEALSLTDSSAISVSSEGDSCTVSFGKKGMKIGFGALAKGYASEAAAAVLLEKGIRSAILNLGGNVQLIGTRPDGTMWKVGVRDPASDDEMLGILAAENCAVITSGGYERYFLENGQVYHHILDPETGYPARSGLTSVTIVCDSGTLADGLSTALFVMGEKKAIRFWRENPELFDMILMCEDGRLLVSEGLNDCFIPDERLSRNFQIVQENEEK